MKNKIIILLTSIILCIICSMPSMSAKKQVKVEEKIDLATAEDYRTDASYNYSKVDSHALAASYSDEKSIDSLAVYLLKGVSNDRERARAIYTWIADRITYDMDSLKSKNIPDQSAAVIFKNRKGVCQGYANLFHDLAVKMKLTDKVVSGYSKGYGYRPGRKFEDTDHAWNAAMVDGKWRLLDVTWGSGAYESGSGKIVKTNSYFWFFTRPEVMIYTHLPEDRKWTLMTRDVTLAEFEDMANLKQSFFELGFDESGLNSKTHVIKTTGNYTITLKGGSGELGAELIENSGRYLQVYHPFMDEPGTEKKNMPVTCVTEGDIKKAVISIADTGTYEVKLHCGQKVSTSNGFHFYSFEILSYKIVVSSGNVTEAEDMAKPAVTYNSFRDLGFSHDSLSHRFYGIKTDKDFRISLEGQAGIDIIAVIESGGVESEELTFSRQDQGKFSVDCTFPSDGMYYLKIFAKRDKNADNYKSIVAYKIYVNGIVKKDKCGFPLTLGDYRLRNAKLIAPMTGFLKKNSVVEFKIEVPKAIEVIVKCGKNITYLKKVTGDTFAGKVKITGDKVNVGAKFEKGSSFPVLVRYRGF